MYLEATADEKWKLDYFLILSWPLHNIYDYFGWSEWKWSLTANT